MNHQPNMSSVLSLATHHSRTVGRRVMVLVPMSETYICKRATEYFTNHLMLADDSVTFVFVVLFEFKQVFVGLKKGEEIKHEMRVQADSLFPELKQILMSSNPRTLLRASQIYQDTIISAGITVSSATSVIDKYLETHVFDLVVLPKNQDKRSMTFFQKVVSRKGVGHVENHILHEYALPSLLVPSMFQMKPANRNSGEETFRRHILFLVDDSISSDYAVRWFATKAMMPAVDVIEMIHLSLLPKNAFYPSHLVTASFTEPGVFKKLCDHLLDKGFSADKISTQCYHTIPNPQAFLAQSAPSSPSFSLSSSSSPSSSSLSSSLPSSNVKTTLRDFIHSKKLDLIVTGSQGIGSSHVSPTISLDRIASYVAYTLDAPALIIPIPGQTSIST